MRIGIGTIQRGRETALKRQACAISGLHDCERHVIVSMDMTPPPLGGAELVHMPIPDGDALPLATARNRAIKALSDLDLIVMLDVDCIPDPRLLVRYADARALQPDGLFIGPVAYLGPTPENRCELTDEKLRAARVRPTKRHFPSAGIAQESRYELFWSLSFALSPETAEHIGGFDEAYRGYGGEDTDYGLRAETAGVGLWKVAGAWAYHQHHGSVSPPTEHLGSIVVNARRFRSRWGFWPMGGWLTQFAQCGLIAWDPSGDTLTMTPRRVG